MKRSRLKRSKCLKPSRVPKGKGKPPKSRQRDRSKAHARFTRNFLSDERVKFVQMLPCVCRGVGKAWGCPGGPCQNSHDPARGMGGAGGTYLDISPKTRECHGKHGQGAKTFWRLIGRTRSEANAETQANWLEYSGDLP